MLNKKIERVNGRLKNFGSKNGYDFIDNSNVVFRHIGHDGLHIDRSFNYEVVDTFPENSLELICIKIIPKVAQPFFVLIWYRPLSSTVDKFSEMENIF